MRTHQQMVRGVNPAGMDKSAGIGQGTEFFQNTTSAAREYHAQNRSNESERRLENGKTCPGHRMSGQVKVDEVFEVRASIGKGGPPEYHSPSHSMDPSLIQTGRFKIRLSGGRLHLHSLLPSRICRGNLLGSCRLTLLPLWAGPCVDILAPRHCIIAFFPQDLIKMGEGNTQNLLGCSILHIQFLC